MSSNSLDQKAGTTTSLFNRVVGIDTVRWGAAAPWRAARAAAGVVLPLIVGWISGNVEYGAFAALGALPAGFASFQGEALSRVAVVAVATVGMAVSTLVGAIVAGTAPWLLVALVALWGYLTGLAVSLGQRASVAVSQWSVALLIAVGLPFGPSEAAVRAALVLAGGLLQAALVAGAWTLRPGSREKAAVAASYRGLAQYAFDVAGSKASTPEPTAFPADTVLQDPNPLLPWPVRLKFIDLLEEAERIRASLATLATHILEASTSEAAPARDFAAEAAKSLNQLGGALEDSAAGPRPDLEARIGELAVPVDVSWHWVGAALLGQLRSVARTITSLETSPRLRAPHRTRSVRPSDRDPSAAASAFAILRANISVASEAGRHALRLGVVAALAEALAQALGVYQGRWIVLTIFLVLRPDYGSTLHRGVQFAIGTSLGVLLGAAAAWLVQAGQTGLGGSIAAVGISIAAAYALFDVSYLLFSVCITVFIVILLELLGIPAIRTAEARFFDTFIGASMALIAYFVWPTWEGSTAQEKLARLLETHGDYVEALLRELAHPGSDDPARLRALQAVARRARSDAEAGTVRLSGEPEHPPLTPEVARALIAAVARLARASLGLHTLVLSPQRPTPQADLTADAVGRLDDLGSAIANAISRLAFALRHLQQADPLPALRPIHAALRAATGGPDEALITVTDRLVDAIDTVGAILRAKLSPPQSQQ